MHVYKLEHLVDVPKNYMFVERDLERELNVALISLVAQEINII